MVSVALAGFLPVPAQTVDEEFFENKIRPVLVENCYGCHNSLDEAQADLALDWKGGIRAKTASGTAVVPFKPEASLLLSVVKHELKGLEMPEGGAKLSAEEIDNLTTWINQGAVDPRVEKPDKEQHAEATSWAETFERRKKWWSLQPLNHPAVPDGYGWSDHPIDRFVHDKLRQNKLQPAPAANPRDLLRRLSYALTGLPPTPEEIELFEKSSDPQGFEKMVDRYLASPGFGEHWARHWMDLVRYADSHGSEGDPAIPNIYQYRDYLIRAFNDDVAYDQLAREHIAGDLMTQPRINQQLGINESAIGPAHFRLVFHGFAPTDALDEKVRFTDDQINVLGKTFQGLTISCARCHDHKFDAISQADYYALFGVLGSCRPAMNDVNQESLQVRNKAKLTKLKGQIQLGLAEHWLGDLDSIPDRLRSIAKDPLTKDRPASQVELIKVWQSLQPNGDVNAGFVEMWGKASRDWDQRQKKIAEAELVANQYQWDLYKADDYNVWFPSGNGLGAVPVKPGDFSVDVSGDRLIAAIYPAGVFSNSLSTLHRAVLGSPTIRADRPLRVWFNLIGGGQSSVRYVVQNYPRSGTVYPIQNVRQPDWYWHSFDMKYWTGDDIHFELATSKDAPLQVGNQQRSWFGIRQVMVRESDQPAPLDASDESVRFLWSHLKNDPPKTVEDLGRCYQTAIREAIQQWSGRGADDEACLFLNACVQLGLLANTPEQTPETMKLVAEYRRLESEIPDPLRVPGIAEAEPRDQPLFERGNHKRPLDPISRRYLAAIDAQPFGSENSGRLELAKALTDPGNPLTARVMSNRLWHWLFGQGIVATPDNFGKLGELPTHPELLDFLAIRLMDHGWSMKQAIRFMVTSKAWQQSSEPGERAREIDPANRLLSHANVRRLSAEAIRDSLLFVSGQLEQEQFGPGFAANRFSPRRSVYVRSNRNSLDAFLQVFDAPVPFATTGRRNETNVPAQSLTLMNDPLVIRMARLAGQRVRGVPHLENEKQRQALLFQQIMGRPCTAEESKLMSDYYESSVQEIRDQRQLRHETELDLERVNEKIRAIIEPARKKLMKQQPASGTDSGLQPIAQWDFSKGLNDLMSGLPGKQVGEIAISENGLKLDGKGFVVTDPLPFGLAEKTMEAWVQIDDLTQRGGGVLSVQDLQGGVFDALVLGEQQPKHWLAGSDNFRRTERLGGPPEASRGQEIIHLALVYDTEGNIRAYRNGKPYGKAYRKGSLVKFAPGQNQVVFGLRHGKQVAGGRMFRGNILEARLYDRALTGEELQYSADRQTFISQESILESLSPGARAELEQHQEKAAQWNARLDRLPPNVDPTEVWTRLSHALFNLKEFIFIE